MYSSSPKSMFTFGGWPPISGAAGGSITEGFSGTMPAYIRFCPPSRGIKASISSGL